MRKWAPDVNVEPLGGMPGQIWGSPGRSEIRPVYISTQDISIRLAKLLHVPRLLAHSLKRSTSPLYFSFPSMLLSTPPASLSLSPSLPPGSKSEYSFSREWEVKKPYTL
ncbi:hypothetical protein QQF64_007940 [Cirrhinus molitorella]|uniref:Uncharacterized protein n=1 Tax=Cirrhinus molitorella TaxID=172907 RepID=A0ABR3M4R1_9TELE